MNDEDPLRPTPAEALADRVHLERAEAYYRRWCRNFYRDPEAVTSMVEFEDYMDYWDEGEAGWH